MPANDQLSVSIAFLFTAMTLVAHEEGRGGGGKEGRSREEGRRERGEQLVKFVSE